jgi:hypothetical protein
MKDKTFLPFILLFIFLGCLPLYARGVMIQKDIFVAEDEVQDNVVAFGGNILIKGKVTESVVAFGGTITVEGEVGELVLGFGSHITLKSSAQVEGDVVALGGTLDKVPGAAVKGDTVYLPMDSFKDLGKFLGGFGVAPFIPLIIIIKLISLFIWLILALIVAAVFPRQLSLASFQIRKSFWPVFGIGLLAIIIFTGLLIFSVFLSFILIGIPILLALIFIAIIIKIFGRVTLFYFFGESISRGFGSKSPSPLLSVIIGLILVGIIGFIPILGSLFAFVLSILGWGVTIRTKFGTTENWFRRG